MMNKRPSVPARSRLRVVGLVLASALMGCASMDANVAMMDDAVVGFTTGEAESIPAVVLAEALVRAGLTRKEVLKDGPSIYRTLATSGGAQFRRGTTVEALLSVQEGRLYVTSRTRGTFVVGLDQPNTGSSGR